jgi:hypothetical protein
LKPKVLEIRAIAGGRMGGAALSRYPSLVVKCLMGIARSGSTHPTVMQQIAWQDLISMMGIPAFETWPLHPSYVLTTQSLTKYFQKSSCIR